MILPSRSRLQRNVEKGEICYYPRMAITVSKAEVKKKGGVVILPLKEYKRLVERAVPEYYLTGKAAERLDKLIKGGLRAHREGRTVLASSISDAMKKFRRRHVR